MPVLRGRLLAAAAGCVGLWISTTSAASTTPTPSVVVTSGTPPPVAIVSTCPSRTINFITETLPQQCLRTDWSSNATASAQPQEDGVITITGPNGEKEVTGTPTASSGGNISRSSYDGSASTPTSGEINSSLSKSLEDPNPPTVEGSPAIQPGDKAGEQDEDPLIDAANFVSFEEWKANMLEKAGQSPETFGGDRKGSDTERRPRPIHQALESLDDDGEIELDFGGFVDPDTVASALPSAKIDGPNEPPDAEPDAVAAGASKRSKNAGTTSKDRTNFASLDCAAQVLKTNSECKGANAILEENKDNYMLNPCHVKNKFFIVELCNDILIDTIALGNYEFFSSTFRQVRFSISDRYPVKPDQWRELGTFEAQNRRGVQAFLIENGLIWGRYLRLEFLGHYGSEYYCPVSLLRVHGKTMMDDYRNDFKTTKGDDEAERDPQVDALKAIKQQQAEGDAAASSNQKGTEGTMRDTTAPKAALFPPQNCRGPGSFNDTCPRTNYFSSLIEQTELLTSNCSKTVRFCNLELTKKIHVVSRAAASKRVISSPSSKPPSSNSKGSKVTGSSPSGPDAPVRITPVDSSSKKSKQSEKNSTQSPPQPESAGSLVQSVQSDAAANITVPISASSVGNATANNSTQATSRTPVQPAPAASPSTQESFFKSVHKRLQLLEANSTLSLQYIEEQSRLLREAFTKVEKRQLSKTTSFLASLNETVLSELREFRTQYDQIWQSTILELSSQREQTLKEAGALSARLAILADEVVWQKRLVYLQFGLILLCLAFFIFGQGSHGNDGQNYLDLPALRDLLTRSPRVSRHGHMRSRVNTGVSIQSGNPGPFESPTSSPSRPVSHSELIWARPLASAPRSDDDEDDEDEPGNVLVSKSQGTEDPSAFRLPTPPSEDDSKPNGLLQVQGLQPALDLEPEVMLRRAISSPALGRDENEGADEEDEFTSPVEPPRVAELARDAERDTNSDEGGLNIMTPTITASNEDSVL